MKEKEYNLNSVTDVPQTKGHVTLPFTSLIYVQEESRSYESEPCPDHYKEASMEPSWDSEAPRCHLTWEDTSPEEGMTS